MTLYTVPVVAVQCRNDFHCVNVHMWELCTLVPRTMSGVLRHFWCRMSIAITVVVLVLNYEEGCIRGCT
jgi:hypothetical protein